MFKKILIANRGEIACRVIRTCRRLGIASVAVHSEADADAPHTRMADEALAIGPAPASESYLRIDRLIAACQKTGAEAVHPGYGFLSENAAFAEALAAAGITFIGPPAAAIRAMGDKIESKRLAREAGVNTVPGHGQPLADPDEARRGAAEIGYPLMIKAAAGGGGKGMRIARDEKGLIEGLERARSEARAAFGDDRVFLEKFIDEPRHIEIQILADRHGRAVHLGERECSIQRRHQKVIEEAPSPFLDEATRKAMGEQATALARTCGYASAGTVEFIVDPAKRFYFLEMNTRLQVEHPVTELVTGLDLVEAMIRIAAGEPLRLAQDDIRLNGWAIEARIYAEDPARGFVPSSGRLVRYAEPREAGIRVDSGIVEGGEVTMFYDPMIAKACAHAATREAAIDRLSDALDGFVIHGLRHNVPFLGAVLGHERFRTGRLSTGFIEEVFGERFEGVSLPEARLERVVAMATAMRIKEEARAREISGQLPGRRQGTETCFAVVAHGRSFDVEAVERDGAYTVTLDGHRTLELVLHWRPGLPLARATIEGELITAGIERLPEGWRMTHGGAVLDILVRRHRAQELARLMPPKPEADTAKLLLSPMPGLILDVPVAVGEEVKAGQTLCVLEAMKMENVLRAERDAVIAAIEVAANDTVAADQILMRFA